MMVKTGNRTQDHISAEVSGRVRNIVPPYCKFLALHAPGFTQNAAGVVTFFMVHCVYHSNHIGASHTLYLLQER